MSDPDAYVHVEIDGVIRSVGRLRTIGAKGKERVSFEFVESWRRAPLHYPLGPALPPTEGTFHAGEGRATFGTLGHSAPERWGRQLIIRNEARRAREQHRTLRALREIDFLLGVSDISRLGSLRFTAHEASPFLAEWDGSAAPPLRKLGSLLAAAEALDDDPDTARADEAVRLLLASGSSLDGARPKASVRDRNGALMIAKFPQADDEVDVVRWEVVMLALANRAGVIVPSARIERVGERAVLLVKRFDRVSKRRVCSFFLLHEPPRSRRWRPAQLRRTG